MSEFKSAMKIVMIVPAHPFAQKIKSRMKFVNAPMKKETTRKL